MNMLITAYDLEVTTPPCDPGTDRCIAVARLREDIGSVLPYLNGFLDKCVYYHEAQALTWRFQGHGVSLRPFEIAVSSLADKEEAKAVVEEVVALVNATWGNRAGLQPDYRKRQRLNPYQVLGLLPGGNCKECGEATCLAFAAKLTLGRADLAQCKPLSAQGRARLQGMLERSA